MTRTPDLVVVGGGVAGWTAARRAQELGADVLLLDRHDTGPGLGNGRYSGGWFHAAYRSPYRPPAELLATIIEKTGGHARPDVARAWAGNVARALDFLRAQGATFAPMGGEEYMQTVLQPARPAEPGLHWRDYGPDRLLNRMWRAFEAAGGEFRPGSRAVELVTGAAGVEGVLTESGEEVRGRSVLLADGGFQSNPELVARHITRTYTLRGAPNAAGDALTMGLAAGAQAVELMWFYGHVLLRDTLTRGTELWPYPSPWVLVDAGAILVDGGARRFFDERLDDEQAAVAIAHCATPGDCWLVFDNAAWTGPASEGVLPPNPTFRELGVTLVEAAGPGALAAACGLPAGRLAESLADPHFGARPPSHPPLRAVPVVAGITFTMGGLLVDGSARVLDDDERPIPGLYAAGGSMGGLQGGRPGGYSGGWSEASTFGLLAAEHAVSVAPRRKEEFSNR